MNDPYIDYQALVKKALKGVVRDILLVIDEKGLEGDHHYYITFRTADEGVEIPKRLKSQYPVEMTIVIQHRYWDLKVEDDGFEIGLSFNQKPELLKIPYAAISSIVDPSVRFALQFDDPKPGDEGAAKDPASGDTKPDQKDDGDQEKVVSIDAFRKS